MFSWTVPITAQRLLLPALILLTPFVVFLDYNAYCYSCTETLIVFGGLFFLALICSTIMLIGGWKSSGLVIAVLLTFFIDLQIAPKNMSSRVSEWLALLLFAGLQTFVLCLTQKEKFVSILTAVFCACFAVTVIQTGLFSRDKISLFNQVEPSKTSTRIIHLVLDEHIGIEGIPTDIEGGTELRNLITEFYINNDFQLFGGAYSRFFNTPHSMSSMLNFQSGNMTGELINGSGPYSVIRNQYFRYLFEGGYKLAVISPAWIDYCSNTPVPIVYCVKYDTGTLKHIPKCPVPRIRNTKTGWIS